MLPSEIQIGNLYTPVYGFLVTPVTKHYHWWIYKRNEIYTLAVEFNRNFPVMLIDWKTNAYHLDIEDIFYDKVTFEKRTVCKPQWIWDQPKNGVVLLYKERLVLTNVRNFESNVKPYHKTL